VLDPIALFLIAARLFEIAPGLSPIAIARSVPAAGGQARAGGRSAG